MDSRNNNGEDTESPFSTPSETGLRTLADLAPIGIFEADVNAQVTYLNPKALEILGRNIAGKLRAWEQVIHPEDRRAVVQGWLQAMANDQSMTSEHRLLKPDGSTIWIRLLSNPIRNQQGGYAGSVGTIEDITDRKEAERALSDSEAYLRHVVDHLPVVLWLCDPEGSCTFLSQRWSEVTGQEVDQGCGHGWLLMLDPENREKVATTYRAAVQGQQPYRTEYRLRLRDGGYAWMLDTSVPYYDGNNQLAGWIGVVLDITDRKKGEADQRAARETAERINQAKSLFLAAASHDLRQPLNAMSLILGSLRREVAGSRALAMLTRMQSSLDAAVKLLNALLDLSKLEAGGVEVHLTTVSASKIFDQLIGDYEREAQSKGLKLRIIPSRAKLRTDPVLILPILRNLIQNAIRYTQAGGVLIGCRRRGTSLRIDVLDTGAGIQPSEMSHIFDEFYQLENPSRSRQAGHGLGLAIVRRTADLLGHPLEVASIPGRGSRFSIEIPLDPGMTADPVDRSDRAVLPGSHYCNVIVIEDDPLVSEAMRWALEDLGCTVRIGISVAEVDDLLDGFDPDVVITDFRLPGDQNGLMAIQTIRARVPHPVAACLITGDMAEQIRTSAEQAGIPWLTKPITIENLSAVVEQACPKGRRLTS